MSEPINPLTPFLAAIRTPEQIEAMVAQVEPGRAGEIRRMLATLSEAGRQAERLATPTGRWFHVSPHRLEAGTVLTPGVVAPTSRDFYTRDGFAEDSGTLADMGATRPEFVWLSTTVEDAGFWAVTLRASHTYEVQPIDAPRPWNGTGSDGWVTTSAVIRPGRGTAPGRMAG